MFWHRARVSRPLALATALLVVLPALGATEQASRTKTSEQLIAELLVALVDAQRHFNLQRLDEILAPDYLEVSPVGEVDRRDAVLGFYAPKNKPAPEAIPSSALDVVETRVYGDLAVTVARLTFQLPQDAGETARRTFRSTFVSRRTDGRWRVVSSQHTAIRTKQ